MICTHCNKPIEKGQPYARTRKGSHHADSSQCSHPEGGLTELRIKTYHPEAYVLLNERDGTRWRGTVDGGWTAEP